MRLGFREDFRCEPRKVGLGGEGGLSASSRHDGQPPFSNGGKPARTAPPQPASAGFPMRGIYPIGGLRAVDAVAGKGFRLGDLRQRCLKAEIEKPG